VYKEPKTTERSLQHGSEKIRMQTRRWTELLQMLEVTTMGSHNSHVGSRTLGEVCYRIVDNVLWQFSQKVCRAAFNSSGLLDVGWSLSYFSSMAPET